MQFGIQHLAPKLLHDEQIDLAVTGINVGCRWISYHTETASNVTLVNTATGLYQSGTVGAACEAVSQGIPAIAFSLRGASFMPYFTHPTPEAARVAAELAVKVTDMVLDGEKPHLPPGAFLNVNIGAIKKAKCDKVSDFRFVMTRINPIVNRKPPRPKPHSAVQHHVLVDGAPPDVQICGTRRLPSEFRVLRTKGCWVSISVGKAATKRDFRKAQWMILEKLRPHLSCLPR